MELNLIENNGMTAAYRRFGKELFEKLTSRAAGIDDGDGLMAPKESLPEVLKDAKIDSWKEK
jgi:hypothetical protein